MPGEPSKQPFSISSSLVPLSEDHCCSDNRSTCLSNSSHARNKAEMASRLYIQSKTPELHLPGHFLQRLQIIARPWATNAGLLKVRKTKIAKLSDLNFSGPCTDLTRVSRFDLAELQISRKPRLHCPAVRANLSVLRMPGFKAEFTSSSSALLVSLDHRTNVLLLQKRLLMRYGK